jgi:hypothetical protein
MRLLEGVAREQTRQITLKLSVDRISSELVEELNLLCQNHPGDHSIRFTLIDRHKKIKLPMKARACQVTASQDFVRALDRLDIPYALN